MKYIKTFLSSDVMIKAAMTLKEYCENNNKNECQGCLFSKGDLGCDISHWGGPMWWFGHADDAKNTTDYMILLSAELLRCFCRDRMKMKNKCKKCLFGNENKHCSLDDGDILPRKWKLQDLHNVSEY